MSKIGQMKTKLMDVMDSLDSIEPKTPTAFNWTPEMQAIWPAEMRPTMSGLLAIWEAMQGAAVYEEAVDGWIKWFGGECPVRGDATVEVRLELGQIQSGRADHYNWRIHSYRNNIIAYRVVK